MSLAANLADLASPPEVRIFEPRTEKERDCHWSFWGTDPYLSALKPACKGIWKRWQIIDHNEKVAHESSVSALGSRERTRRRLGTLARVQSDK